jgi:hypothetical protein
MQKLRFPLPQVRCLRLAPLHHTRADHSKQGILVVTNQEVPGGYDRKWNSNGRSSRHDN